PFDRGVDGFSLRLRISFVFASENGEARRRRDGAHGRIEMAETGRRWRLRRGVRMGGAGFSHVSNAKPVCALHAGTPATFRAHIVPNVYRRGVDPKTRWPARCQI